MIHRQCFGRGLQRSQCLADGRIVQGRQPKALDRTAIVTQFNNLAGDHFAFAIGVSRDHQLGSLCQQLLDDFELRGGLGFDFDTPMLGNNGQLLNRPAFKLLVIGFGRCRLDQMANAPGHDDAWAFEATVVALRGTEHFANIFALGGLLAQK